MFTGIVQGKGQVIQIEDKPGLRRLTIAMPTLLEGLAIGASVAVNGTCLTAVSFDQETVTFDVIDETLRLTNLSELVVNDEVNIERSLKMGDEIGGHVLSGHIHGMATLTDVRHSANNVQLTFECPASLSRFLLPKGYVALDGASLTLGDTITEHRFTVHLIPETLALTTFAGKQPGAHINIEIDSQTQTIVQTVERIMQK